MATVYKTTTTSPSLLGPRGLAVYGEIVMIADAGNNQIYKCSLNGFKPIQAYTQYSAASLTSFSSPGDVCYHDGFFYICDTGNHVVIRMDINGNYKDKFGTIGTSGSTDNLLSSPGSLCTDGYYLYICDSANGRIMKLKLSDLSYVSKASSINGALSDPCGICIDKKGDKALYISDAGNSRLIKATRDLSYIGQNDTGLSFPLHCDILGDIVHVCDGKNEIIAIDTAMLTVRASISDTTVVLSDPHGIVTHRDSIIITDRGNNRITAWRGYIVKDSAESGDTLKFNDGDILATDGIIAGVDSVIAGTTQESGSPNRWIEEVSGNQELGWVEG